MLAQGTLVLDGQGNLRPVESFAPGETVLTADLDRTWTARRVWSSMQSPRSVAMITFEGGSILVSPEQVFVLADRSLRRTTELEVGDSLMAADGRTLVVHTNVLGQSSRPFYELITWLPDSTTPLSSQLLSTAGLLSTDLGGRPLRA